MRVSNVVYEYRVWCENGDLIAGADIHHDNGWWTVYSSPFMRTESMHSRGFRKEASAQEYANDLAERYMSEAIAAETKERGETPTGMLTEHGYLIQIVENGS